MDTSPNNTVSVPSNTLRVGDVVLCHGGIFKVFDVKRYEDGPHGVVQASRCEFLGNIHADYECQIPKHWRDGAPDLGNPGRTNHWVVQGNDLARTTLVVDPSK